MDNRQKSQPSHHRTDGGFQNPPGSPANTSTFGDMLSFLRKQLFSTSAPTVPDGHVLSKTEHQAQLAKAGNPSITWLGHAAFIVRVGGKVILTDP